MGINLRSIMPLLSTLAALVIIVHSAQEDTNMDYNVESMPKVLEIENPEQSQKAIDTDSIVEQTMSAEQSNYAPTEAPYRRRSGRKRKRQPNPIGDEIPEEKLLSPVDHYKEFPFNVRPKRRKRPDSTSDKRWNIMVDKSERPHHSILQTRERSMESRPQFREYDNYSFEVKDPENVESDVSLHNNYDSYINNQMSTENKQPKQYINKEMSVSQMESVNTKSEERIEQFDAEKFEDLQYKETQYKGDKSLSVFNPDAREKDGDSDSSIVRKPVTTFKEKISSPIDPKTLKNILKKSNGRSLSEILQQHNLSLADLLQGSENAISALKIDESVEVTNREINENDSVDLENKTISESTNELKITAEPLKITNSSSIYDSASKNMSSQELNQTSILKKNSTNILLKRKMYPVGIRRKLRMKPVEVFNSQHNKGLLTSNSRKYRTSNKRNATKAGEWKNAFSIQANSTKVINQEEKLKPQNNITITADVTNIKNFQNSSQIPVLKNDTNNKKISVEIIEEVVDTTTHASDFVPMEMIIENATENVTTEKLNRSEIVRRINNNKIKRKRVKQKPETEPPAPELNAASQLTTLEYSASTQQPNIINLQDNIFFTTLEDFMTTIKNNVVISDTTTATSESPIITTEESSKQEIEEILNDTRVSARLSEILMERNMTLNELVEHRERGSSHVHLADIFHNASREPNPAEPFLSKSLIEPISKETYPLRALLEANIYDTTTKATTVDNNFIPTNSINIPIVMDFGNNVNENGENMGIMSLFRKFTDNTVLNNSTIKKDSEGTPYMTSIVSVANTDSERESRRLNESIKWHEILPLIERSNNNETGEEFPAKGIPPFEEKDVDGDGLIVLEDLQHLRGFENNIESASDEKQFSYERTESALESEGILHTSPNSVKSVTVATASIMGLGMILFLFTYAVFKWKYQRRFTQNNDSFSEERIPTPVFENRKEKNNSSMRSISPMLSATNIYTMTAINPASGTDSTDYAWDDLRKPFQ